jgi:hypothetical protein
MIKSRGIIIDDKDSAGISTGKGSTYTVQMSNNVILQRFDHFLSSFT